MLLQVNKMSSIVIKMPCKDIKMQTLAICYFNNLDSKKTLALLLNDFQLVRLLYLLYILLFL